jgi:hypothetical protein
MLLAQSMLQLLCECASVCVTLGHLCDAGVERARTFGSGDLFAAANSFARDDAEGRPFLRLNWVE